MTQTRGLAMSLVDGAMICKSIISCSCRSTSGLSNSGIRYARKRFGIKLGRILISCSTNGQKPGFQRKQWGTDPAIREADSSPPLTSARVYPGQLIHWVEAKRPWSLQRLRWSQSPHPDQISLNSYRQGPFRYAD